MKIRIGIHNVYLPSPPLDSNAFLRRSTSTALFPFVSKPSTLSSAFNSTTFIFAGSILKKWNQILTRNEYVNIIHRRNVYLWTLIHQITEYAAELKKHLTAKQHGGRKLTSERRCRQSYKRVMFQPVV